MTARHTAILSVDLEDYRRQELRDILGCEQPSYPDEVERQLDILLESFAQLEAQATFFTVGRLTTELKHSVWSRIVKNHVLREFPPLRLLARSASLEVEGTTLGR